MPLLLVPAASPSAAPVPVPVPGVALEPGNVLDVPEPELPLGMSVDPEEDPEVEPELSGMPDELPEVLGLLVELPELDVP